MEGIEGIINKNNTLYCPLSCLALWWKDKFDKLPGFYFIIIFIYCWVIYSGYMHILGQIHYTAMITRLV